MSGLVQAMLLMQLSIWRGVAQGMDAIAAALICELSKSFRRDYI